MLLKHVETCWDGRVEHKRNAPLLQDADSDFDVRMSRLGNFQGFCVFEALISVDHRSSASMMSAATSSTRDYPGKPGAGSFKFETLIALAYRAGPGKPPVLRGNRLLSCQSDAMSFECWIFSHFIWSHRVAASLGNCSLHPIVTAVCVIPSPHLNSYHVFWVFSAHLSSSQLMSSYLSAFDVISFSSKSTCSLVVFRGCSSHVKTFDLSSVFLTLAFQSLSQTQQDTAAAFSM